MAHDKSADDGKMKREVHEKELHKLQVELCHVQDWVKAKGLRVMVVFEGSDAAGKGGTIKAITERVARASFGWLRCPRRPTVKKRKCGCNATSSTFGCGRDRDFRPQLVQPGGRRERHGIH